MGTDQKKSISVFIASPGDLVPERKMFRDTIDQLNHGFGDGAGVQFEALGWEDENAEAGRRVQDVLNKQIAQCDLFVLALYGRWGQKAPDSPYASYTEEEFQVAMGLWEQHKCPEVLVFFKNVDAARIADPGPQLTQVLDFRKKLENRHDILFRAFNSEVDFGQQIDKHLRDFARGEWEKLDDQIPSVTFSKNIAGSLEAASQASEQRFRKAEENSREIAKAGTIDSVELKTAAADVSLVQQYQKEFALARAAMDAVSNQRIEDAKILFAQATEETTDLSILAAAADFYRQVNDIENSSRMVLRQASIARDRTIAAQHYLQLVPQGMMLSMVNQVLENTLAQDPPEEKAEVLDICQEIYGGAKFEKVLIDMLVHFYTLEEIVQLATFLASPVGQSSLVKQPQFTVAMMAYVQDEYLRIYRERHPKANDAAGNEAAAAEQHPPLLEAASTQQAKTGPAPQA